MAIFKFGSVSSGVRGRASESEDRVAEVSETRRHRSRASTREAKALPIGEGDVLHRALVEDLPADLAGTLCVQGETSK